MIANFWLSNRYKDKYVDVLRELVYELKPHKWFWKPIIRSGFSQCTVMNHYYKQMRERCEIYPINNIRATKVQILLDKFNKYDEDQLWILIHDFAHSIYWHSTTVIHEPFGYMTAHMELANLSYQTLLAFKDYINDDNYPDGYDYNVEPVKNSWVNPTYGPCRSPSLLNEMWMRPGDSLCNECTSGHEPNHPGKAYDYP